MANQTTLKDFLNSKNNNPSLAIKQLKEKINNIYKDSQNGCTKLKEKIEIPFDKNSQLKEKFTNYFSNIVLTDTIIDKISALKETKGIHNQRIIKIFDLGEHNTAESKEFAEHFQQAIGMKKNDKNPKNRADGIIGSDTIDKFLSLLLTKKETKKTVNSPQKDEKETTNKSSPDESKAIEYMKKRLNHLSDKEKSKISDLYGNGEIYNKRIAIILGFNKIFENKSKEDSNKKLNEFGIIFQSALNLKTIDKMIGDKTLLLFLEQKNPDFLQKKQAEFKEKMNNIDIQSLKNIDSWTLENLSLKKGNQARALARILKTPLKIGETDAENNKIESKFATFIQKDVLKMKLKKYGYIGRETINTIWKKTLLKEGIFSGETEEMRQTLMKQVKTYRTKYGQPSYYNNGFKQRMSFTARKPGNSEQADVIKRLSRDESYKKLQKTLFKNNTKGLLLDTKTNNLYIVSATDKGLQYEKSYKTATGTNKHRTPKGFFTMGSIRKGGLGSVQSNEDRLSPQKYNKKFAKEIRSGQRQERKYQKYKQGAYIRSVSTYRKITVSTIFNQISGGVGAHATNAEQSITAWGNEASHGCLRMTHADVINMYYHNKGKKYSHIAII